jgi:hypothetical protein
MTEVVSHLPAIRRPYYLAEAIGVAEAARQAGKSMRTMREWCAMYRIGRIIRWALGDQPGRPRYAARWRHRELGGLPQRRSDLGARALLLHAAIDPASICIRRFADYADANGSRNQSRSAEGKL